MPHFENKTASVRHNEREFHRQKTERLGILGVPSTSSEGDKQLVKRKSSEPYPTNDRAVSGSTILVTPEQLHCALRAVAREVLDALRPHGRNAGLLTDVRMEDNEFAAHQLTDDITEPFMLALEDERRGALTPPLAASEDVRHAEPEIIEPVVAMVVEESQPSIPVAVADDASVRTREKATSRPISHETSVDSTPWTLRFTHDDNKIATICGPTGNMQAITNERIELGQELSVERENGWMVFTGRPIGVANFGLTYEAGTFDLAVSTERVVIN